MADLSGKTLFISGASRGIGLAIAKRAAADGANIAIAAKTTEPHPRLSGTIYTAADEIREAGGQALPLLVDVRYEDQVEAAVVHVYLCRVRARLLIMPVPLIWPVPNPCR